MLTLEEQRLLDIIKENKVVRKSELIEIIKAKYGIRLLVLEDLIKKGFVSKINPLGETSFAITEEGLKELEKF